MAHENKVNRLASIFAAATLGATALLLGYHQTSDATTPQYYGGKNYMFDFHTNNGKGYTKLMEMTDYFRNTSDRKLIVTADYFRNTSDRICTQETYYYVGPLDEFNIKSESFLNFAEELNWKDIQKIHADLPTKIKLAEAMLRLSNRFKIMDPDSDVHMWFQTERKCGDKNVLEKYGMEYDYPEGKNKPGKLRHPTM